MSEVLRAEGLSMYFGGLKAVENVDMTINKGDIFGIIGPNGAGKTTFFNICSGIYKPTKGHVYLNGEEITGMAPEAIAKKGMARTFQNIKLFNYMTVLENVKIGFHNSTKTGLVSALFHNKRYKDDEAFIQKRGLEILEMVGLMEYANTMAGNLAYGLQRRVEIARALALEPKILLLDEPAAGMNPNETQDLVVFIHELRNLGYTVAVIEHDMKFVMNSCNRILVLNFGQTICEGTPEHTKSNKAVQEAYFGKGLVVGEAVLSNA